MGQWVTLISILISLNFRMLSGGSGWIRVYENDNATLNEPERAGRCGFTWWRRSQTRRIGGGRCLLRQRAGDGRHCSNIRMGGLPVSLQYNILHS